MKYENEFIKFLEEDKQKDYYYNIDYINIIKGKDNKQYYEIFINNLNDWEDNDGNVIVERFMQYLNNNNINYNFEDLYYDITEYVSEFDSKEREEI